MWWLAGATSNYLLGWFCLVPLWWLVWDLAPRDRFKWGYLAGFVSFWMINWWLIPTIMRSSPVVGIPPVLGLMLGVLAVTIIAAGHALGPALAALAWHRPGPRAAILVTVVWVLFDYLRMQGPLAHSWGALAFSQTADLPLINALPQQHLLSAYCVLISTLVVLCWRTSNRALWGVTGSFVVLVHATGLVILATPLPPGRPWRALLVQTNVGSLRKTLDSRGETPGVQAIRLTLEGMEKAAQEVGGGSPGFSKPLDLVIWPETTSQLFWYDGKYAGLDWSQWTEQKIPTQNRPALLMGAAVGHTEGHRTNEAILIQPDLTVSRYQKSHLVPFGERAPFAEWIPALQLLAPRPALQAGAPGQKSLALVDPPVALRSLICFESCFPLWRSRAPGATPDQALVVLTNDEWFAGTEVPAQHRSMAILRAVESGSSLLQAANGGYSFRVDARGRVRESLPFGEPGSLLVRLP